MREGGGLCRIGGRGNVGGDKWWGILEEGGGGILFIVGLFLP